MGGIAEENLSGPCWRYEKDGEAERQYCYKERVEKKGQVDDGAEELRRRRKQHYRVDALTLSWVNYQAVGACSLGESPSV